MGMHAGLEAGDTSDTPIFFLRYDKFGERLFNAAIGVQCVRMYIHRGEWGWTAGLVKSPLLL